jgi:hypothetical protein
LFKALASKTNSDEGKPIWDAMSNYLNITRTEGDRVILSGWWENRHLKYTCFTEKNETACQHEESMRTLKSAGKIVKDIWTLKPLTAAANATRKSIEDPGGDSRQACANLYVGKAVSFRACGKTLVLQRKKCDSHRAVITGMNPDTGDATVMIRENYDSYRNGQLLNLSCSALY